MRYTALHSMSHVHKTIKDNTFCGVATGGVKVGQGAPLDSEKNAKNREEQGKIGKRGKNREGSFTFPLLTDRSGYATAFQ